MRMGILAWVIVLPKKDAADPLTYTLHESARWRHVQVAVGEGVVVLHVQAVNAIVNVADLDAQLLEKVLEHSCLGCAPHIITCGFNAPMGNRMKVPRSLAMALINRRRVDLERELAEAEARPSLCHFQGPPGTHPSGIDSCLFDLRSAFLARWAWPNLEAP